MSTAGTGNDLEAECAAEHMHKALDEGQDTCTSAYYYLELTGIDNICCISEAQYRSGMSQARLRRHAIGPG